MGGGADAWDDDDAPPPLSALADQVHAVTLSRSIIGTAGLKGGELRVATTTPTAPAARAGAATAAGPAAADKPFKRGFLDAPKPRQQQQQASGRSSSSSRKVALPLLKPQQQQGGGAKPIPECCRLELPPEQQRLAAVKSQLVAALQPTPDTIQAVGQDPTLMAGFEDPEVMAAVAEVARDPGAIKKYATQPKVLQFYAAMGQLLGSKLETMSGGGGGSGSGQAAVAPMRRQQQSQQQSVRFK